MKELFLRKQLTAFGRYFCKSAPSYMLDWGLNRPTKRLNGSYKKPFYFSNSETLKVEKNSFTRVSDMNWLANENVTKILLWICLISCCSNRNLLY